MRDWTNWLFSVRSEVVLSSGTKTTPTLVFKNRRTLPRKFGFAFTVRLTDATSHFGPLHKHGWMPHPKNGPEEFVIVYDSKE